MFKNVHTNTRARARTRMHAHAHTYRVERVRVKKYYGSDEPSLFLLKHTHKRDINPTVQPPPDAPWIMPAITVTFKLYNSKNTY